MPRQEKPRSLRSAPAAVAILRGPQIGVRVRKSTPNFNRGNKAHSSGNTQDRLEIPALQTAPVVSTSEPPPPPPPSPVEPTPPTPTPPATPSARPPSPTPTEPAEEQAVIDPWVTPPELVALIQGGILPHDPDEEEEGNLMTRMKGRRAWEYRAFYDIESSQKTTTGIGSRIESVLVDETEQQIMASRINPYGTPPDHLEIIHHV
ncbi:hypothetical protein SISNIDRAFT_491854 [Sistotremastrum niveocremeum HHB9708]|uniref:Uncharacterized protein n=1 Tax=Sistotremastrum niveocremeum HHB9708 TaxID=1314777 RepID=A0A164MB02_9AGAM|nr:hypothetical protein SISNIDRAFT_491854 [Sistotremastrum niveocremeum HHB9708]